MTEKFKWRVEVESTGEGSLNALKIQFGEGLSQSFTEGINNEVQKWGVSLGGHESYIKPILEFIRTHKGAHAFEWTPPLGDPGLYQCGKYKLSDEGGAYYKLTMDFEQVFFPQ